MYALMVHIVAICKMLCIIIMRELLKYIFSVLEEQGIKAKAGYVHMMYISWNKCA